MSDRIFEAIDTIEEKYGFNDFFQEIPDHRLDRKKLHSVPEILFLALCGVIANCNSWEDLELFGKSRLDYLRKYFPYKNGVPSDDTFRRFFRVLDPKIFETKFRQWIANFGLSVSNKVIAIDGKTSRHSFDKECKAIHMVSAFLSEDRIVLGQEKVSGKSNEITAIPELIESLDIQNSIITIDAMGAQHAIANMIVSKSAHYVLSLKGNQSSLAEDVTDLFKNIKDDQFESHEDVDSGHGRLEVRRCIVVSDTEWMKWLISSRPEWSSIKSVIKITSVITINDQTTTEDRYYITSMVDRAQKLLTAIRSHWGVESMHWVLDVTFGDDQSRVRKGNAPQNMAVIKKSALNLLQIIKNNYPRIDGVRTSIARLRKIASWDNQWLDNILNAKFG